MIWNWQNYKNSACHSHAVFSKVYFQRKFRWNNFLKNSKSSHTYSHKYPSSSKVRTHAYSVIEYSMPHQFSYVWQRAKRTHDRSLWFWIDLYLKGVFLSRSWWHRRKEKGAFKLEECQYFESGTHLPSKTRIPWMTLPMNGSICRQVRTTSWTYAPLYLFVLALYIKQQGCGTFIMGVPTRCRGLRLRYWAWRDSWMGLNGPDVAAAFTSS